MAHQLRTFDFRLVEFLSSASCQLIRIKKETLNPKIESVFSSLHEISRFSVFRHIVVVSITWLTHLGDSRTVCVRNAIKKKSNQTKREPNIYN